MAFGTTKISLSKPVVQAAVSRVNTNVKAQLAIVQGFQDSESNVFLLASFALFFFFFFDSGEGEEKKKEKKKKKKKEEEKND